MEDSRQDILDCDDKTSDEASRSVCTSIPRPRRQCEVLNNGMRVGQENGQLQIYRSFIIYNKMMR